MDYKNETEIVIGLTAYMSDQTTSSVSIFAINPSSEWNKVYVNLTPTLSYMGDAMKFKLYFGGILGEGQDSAVNYFDNIKIALEAKVDSSKLNLTIRAKEKKEEMIIDGKPDGETLLSAGRMP